jgi:hypothetical protein
MAVHGICVYLCVAGCHANRACSGIRHSTPNMDAEIAAIASYLREEKLHSKIPTRPGNDQTPPVTDLLADGSMYSLSKRAFKNFLIDKRRAQYDESDDSPENQHPQNSSTDAELSTSGEDTEYSSSSSISEDTDMSTAEDFEVGEGDLAADNEEYP